MVVRIVVVWADPQYTVYPNPAFGSSKNKTKQKWEQPCKTTKYCLYVCMYVDYRAIEPFPPKKDRRKTTLFNSENLDGEGGGGGRTPLPEIWKIKFYFVLQSTSVVKTNRFDSRKDYVLLIRGTVKLLSRVVRTYVEKTGEKCQRFFAAMRLRQNAVGGHPRRTPAGGTRYKVQGTGGMACKNKAKVKLLLRPRCWD